MVTDLYSREQRLRKQAELQSLYSNLANLREGAEASYIKAGAAIPERLINQINELRHEIESVESELLALNDESIQSSTHQFYRDAFAAELANDSDQALKLYKKASRHAHPDAGAAARSLRYRLKISKSKSTAGKIWTATSGNQFGNRLLIALATFLILLLIAIIAINGFRSSQPQQAVAVEPTATVTSTPPVVVLIIPDTATPTPTGIPTSTPVPIPTNTPRPTPTETVSPTLSPTPTPILRGAPKIIDPKDGLVWVDGAIVFEFEKLDLAYDELYCLNTLRGYDKTNTENWSFPPTGSKEPRIPIEAHVFRIAKIEGMRCIVWSAAIGKGNCQNPISESTEERIIGLPRPCEFK